jgi:hypothetical protein
MRRAPFPVVNRTCRQCGGPVGRVPRAQERSRACPGRHGFSMEHESPQVLSAQPAGPLQAKENAAAGRADETTAAYETQV